MMMSDIRRRIHSAMVEAGGLECWTLTDAAEFAVRKGDDLHKVIQELRVSCPHLFHDAPPKQKAKHERQAKSPASQDDSWRDE